MSISTTTISAREVINDLVPKLNAVEKKERYAKLKAEFELELTMIRMKPQRLKTPSSCMRGYSACSKAIK